MAIVKNVVKAWEEMVKYVPGVIYEYLPKSLLRRSLLVGTITGSVAYFVFKKRYRLPPGPFALPFIGNFHLFTKGSIAKKFLDLSKKYGPAFTFYMGPTRCLILNRIDVINEALISKGAHYSDRMSFYSSDVFLDGGEDILASRYGTAWKLRRKVASRAMRMFVVQGGLNKKIEEAVSKTISVMLEEKGAFDPKPYMFFTTLNILGAMVFGNQYDYHDQNYKDLLFQFEEMSRTQSESVLLENIFPPVRLCPTKRFRYIHSLFKKLLKYMDEEVKRIKRTFQPGKVSNFTESLLQAEQEIREEGQEDMDDFKHNNIVLTVFDIFFAGNDTSRQTIYWALLYIAGIPEVQRKIQEEVDLVVGKDRYPTTADRENLSYTDAVLHEVMRIGSVAPLGVPHMTSCDTTICNGKYDVPKDTLVFINHWGIQNDPDKWEDVDQFKPERFLDEYGKMAPKPDNWLPFGAGRRVCLGEPMAKPELHLILASICQRLHLETEPGIPVDLKPVENGLLLGPCPYKLVVQPRN